MSDLFRKGERRHANYYAPGDYNVFCDRTGFKVKASECQMEWNGLLVRSESWEARHPQDTIRGVKDDQSVPIARPKGDPTFVPSGGITVDDLG